MSGVGFWTCDAGSSVLTCDADTNKATADGWLASGSESSGASSAGSSGRRHVRNIYRLKIDGQPFEFRSLAEALTFLEKSKSVAYEYALRKTREATEKQRTAKGKIPLPELPRPKIEISSRELRGAVAETKREILDFYRKALEDANVAMIAELDSRTQHNEDVLWWLM